ARVPARRPSRPRAVRGRGQGARPQVPRPVTVPSLVSRSSLLVPRCVVVVAVVLVACSSSGAVSAPKGSPVPGTFASVGHHSVTPVYVGEFIGRLKKVGDGCSGA